jgi:hypothetical protein
MAAAFGILNAKPIYRNKRKKGKERDKQINRLVNTTKRTGSCFGSVAGMRRNVANRDSFWTWNKRN